MRFFSALVSLLSFACAAPAGVAQATPQSGGVEPTIRRCCVCTAASADSLQAVDESPDRETFDTVKIDSVQIDSADGSAFAPQQFEVSLDESLSQFVRRDFWSFGARAHLFIAGLSPPTSPLS